MLNRRRFLQITAAGSIGIAATASWRHLADSPARHTPFVPAKAIDERRLPRFQGSADTQPALIRRYPWVRFGEKSGHAVQIANGYNLPHSLEQIRTSGPLSERSLHLRSTHRVLPWTPMFERPSPVSEANAAVKALASAGRLYIKDEGSETSLLYGNKVRKFEFLLPNLAFSGIEKVSTHGGIGSNHCAYLALAARYGAYGPGGHPTITDVELKLYPQEITENVVTKLKLLVASGARLEFLEGDASVGLSILTQQFRTRDGEAGTAAYVPPGGSSPLTVLAHVEALMELAEQVESGECALSTPPDYIFVPLGSGATAMGLVLGCHLLGWATRVVGTCSQDKSRIARLVVNGDIDTPFLVKNAELLLAKALKWVDAMGLRPGARSSISSREILRENFAYDNESWLPEFGKATAEIEREAASAAEAGLVLDSTFTAKSFHTLGVYAARGLLKSSSALFWNSYQRFPLNTLLPEDRNWMRALPESMRASVDAYTSSGSAG